jgi:hypothetical protein
MYIKCIRVYVHIHAYDFCVYLFQHHVWIGECRGWAQGEQYFGAAVFHEESLKEDKSWQLPPREAGNIGCSVGRVTAYTITYVITCLSTCEIRLFIRRETMFYHIIPCAVIRYYIVLHCIVLQESIVWYGMVCMVWYGIISIVYDMSIWNHITLYYL